LYSGPLANLDQPGSNVEIGSKLFLAVSTATGCSAADRDHFGVANDQNDESETLLQLLLNIVNVRQRGTGNVVPLTRFDHRLNCSPEGLGSPPRDDDRLPRPSDAILTPGMPMISDASSTTFPSSIMAYSRKFRLDPPATT
jgi:hypothetical protein